MKPKDRIKVLNSTKQSSVRKFDSPPGPKVGREGDLGVAVVPKKGLHLFYKLGGKWHGVRLESVFNTKEDDERIVLPNNNTKENGEISYIGGKVEIQTSNETRKELYRAGGTDIPVADGGTGASTEDGALDNLGGTTVGKNVFKAADQATARSALNVDESGTDSSTPVTFAAGAKDYLSLSGQEITVGLVDLSDNVTGLLATSKLDISANVKTLLDNANTADFISDLALDAADISDFDTEVTNNSAVAANTAKTSFPGFGSDGTTAAVGNDSRLSDARQCNNTFVNSTTARSNLGVDPAGTDNSTPVTIASGKDYISLSGQELTLGNIDLTSDVTGTLPVGNTEAKCTDPNADQTTTALRTLAGTTELTSLDMANDNIFISDASDGSNVHRSTAKVLTSAMAGDGLSSTSGVMAVSVDDTTIEINSDTLRLKAAGIDTTHFTAATLVTESGVGEGISNNDNDTTIPTSAAVKDYVDNNAGGTFSGSITTNQIAHGSGTDALQGTDSFSFTNGLLSMETSDSSTQKPRLTFLNSHSGNESGAIFFNNDSTSPAMNDKLMQISINGKNNASGTQEDIEYASIDAKILSFADGSESSYIDFKTMANGNERTLLSLFGESVLVQGTDGNTAFKIKSSADASDYFDITVDANAATTIKTHDNDATLANLTLDVDGDIELNADGGDIVFKDDTAPLATINSDGLTIRYDGSSHAVLNSVNGAGDFTISTVGNILGTGVTNELTLKNATSANDQYAVFGNGGEAVTLTSKGTYDIRLDTNSGTNSGFLHITDGADGLITLQPNGTGTLLLGVNGGAVQFATNTFLDANGNSLFGTAVASSAVNNIELGNAATGNAATLKATGTDTNVPLTVSTKGTGAVTIDSGGDIALDAASGNFIAKKGGAEFSVANSAYAGMILGYTYLHPTTTLKSFEIQNAITVEDDIHKITFKTPPSQKVEIEVTALINCSSTDTRITVGLSSANATDGYSAVAGQFEYDSTGIFFTDDEVDDQILTFKFVVESAHLAAVASDNTFWIGFGTAGATKTAYLQYGYRNTHGIGNHPFIIKATALPTTIYDGS